jgi:GTPase SAR1 family protein
MIADRYLQLKGELENNLTGLIKLSSEMQRPAEQLETLQALLRGITEPLLFVAVGEVKSGKSSLLNALFGSEFAKVDVLPATDRVYIFRYAAEEKSIEVSPKMTERYLPISFLRDFNVVDTPGTNTMVKEHQMVAEDFMPRADVVVFVFSVANPWTQSNWEFLDFLHKTWLKNVIFVLQQIDLREPTEIDVIYRHLQDTAMRRLGFVPPIFAVSARKALLARTSGLDKEKLWEESAFQSLQDQINFIVTESSTRMLKLRSTFQAARTALESLNQEIRAFLDKISADIIVLDRVDALLRSRREQMLRQVKSLVREIESAYDETAKERRQFLRDKPSWWQGFRLIWSKGKPLDLRAALEQNLRELMEPQMEKAVKTVEADLRGVWPQMQDLLENRLSPDLQKQARQTLPDFVGQRRQLSDSIQTVVMNSLAGKELDEELGRAYSQTAIRLRLVVAILVISAAVGFLFQSRNEMIGIGGLVLAGIAAVLAFLVAINHRRSILRIYEHELSPQAGEFGQALDNAFVKVIDSFCAEMANRFQELRRICQNNLDRFQPRSQRAEELQTKLSALSRQLG